MTLTVSLKQHGHSLVMLIAEFYSVPCIEISLHENLFQVIITGGHHCVGASWQVLNVCAPSCGTTLACADSMRATLYEQGHGWSRLLFSCHITLHNCIAHDQNAAVVTSDLTCVIQLAL